MGDRIREVAIHEHVDSVVERGREQHALSGAGGLVENALHHRQETEVGHVVGLVDHRRFDRGQTAVALVHEVLESARTRDHDVNPTMEGVHLRVLSDASVDGHLAETDRARQRLERRRHLTGEFAGGNQHETAWFARARTASIGGQPGHQRKHEGERLATAGATTTDDVATRQRVGERGALNGEGFGDAGTIQNGDDLGGNSEVPESRLT